MSEIKTIKFYLYHIVLYLLYILFISIFLSFWRPPPWLSSTHQNYTVISYGDWQSYSQMFSYARGYSSMFPDPDFQVPKGFSNLRSIVSSARKIKIWWEGRGLGKTFLTRLLQTTSILVVIGRIYCYHFKESYVKN